VPPFVEKGEGWLMASFNFDTLAQIYDATRGYPEEVACQIAQKLVRLAGKPEQKKWLEVGIGTGRVAIPLAEQGLYCTGIDISTNMLDRLEQKLKQRGWQAVAYPWGTLEDERVASIPRVVRYEHPELVAALRVALADMTAIPFESGSFDVLLAIHVFHLVDGWQQAVRECLRVLRPGGVFLRAWDESVPSDISKIAETFWRMVEERGGKKSLQALEQKPQVDAFLEELGWHSEEDSSFTWVQATTPRQELESYLQRQWSSLRRIPDEIFQSVIGPLEEWAYSYYGEGIDTVRKCEERFVVSRSVWKS
jgi:ubiquinone/menaquinone biosynthesis C-methylase UbiE